jgi:hypothetical protein
MKIPTVPIINSSNPRLNKYDDKYFNANKYVITNMFKKHDLQKISMKTNIQYIQWPNPYRFFKQKFTTEGIDAKAQRNPGKNLAKPCQFETAKQLPFILWG